MTTNVPGQENIDRTLGDYRLRRKLGEGGMGEVYLAEHVLMGHLVAVKLLWPQLGARAEVRERFIREAQIQRNLEHSKILRVETMTEAEERLVIVSEYVEGRSLEEVIAARGQLPPDDALLLFQQVAVAVGFAHEAGVVHRDLKPANVMVRADGCVKVLDFGIAKVVGSTRLTRTGTTMGSPH